MIRACATIIVSHAITDELGALEVATCFYVFFDPVFFAMLHFGKLHLAWGVLQGFFEEY
jgi:hypothetical protein